MPFLILIFASALLLSSVSFWFSVSGLLAIFPGSTVPIICMGIALEVGKLVGVSWLFRHWNITKGLIRAYMLCAMVVLSLVSSVSVYGWLAKNHIEGGIGIATGADQIAYIQTQIDMEEGVVREEARGMEQQDKVVEHYLLDTARTAKAEESRNNMRRERSKAADRLTGANKAILGLTHQKDSLSQIQRQLNMNVGPLRYLTQLFGSTDIEKAVRWFAVVLCFVLDPLAIALILAGNAQWKVLSDIPVKLEQKRQITTQMPKNDSETVKVPKSVLEMPPIVTLAPEQPSADLGFTGAIRRILKVEHPH